jgi:hypothetical protein
VVFVILVQIELYFAPSSGRLVESRLSSDWIWTKLIIDGCPLLLDEISESKSWMSKVEVKKRSEKGSRDPCRASSTALSPGGVNKSCSEPLANIAVSLVNS